MITRWDDGQRGPAVADSFQLNECLVQLEESAIDWPEHPEEAQPVFQQVFMATYPPDQLQGAIAWYRRNEGAISLLRDAVLNGQIELHFVDDNGCDKPVAKSALVEFGRETIMAGVYRPYNDRERTRLFGKPLFVKRTEWVAWLNRHLNEQPSSAPNRRAPPVDFEELKSWLAEQYRSGAITDAVRDGYPAAKRQFPNNYVKRQTVIDAWRWVKQ